MNEEMNREAGQVQTYLCQLGLDGEGTRFLTR